MNHTAKWLEPYRELIAPPQFIKALGQLIVLPGRADEPGQFLDDLLIPVEQYVSQVRDWTEHLVGGPKAEKRTVPPRVLLSEILSETEKLSTVPQAKAQLLAQACKNLGNRQAAELCAAVAYLNSGNSLTVLELLTAKALREGQLDVAQELVGQALSLYPATPEALHGQAALEVARGDSQRATALLKPLVEEFPGHLPAWNLLLNTLAAANQWTGVLEALDSAPRQVCDSNDATRLRAHALSATGEKQKALTVVEEALAIGPEDAELTITLADLNAEAGRDQQAFDGYQRAAELDPARSDAMLKMAGLLIKNGQLAPAIEVAGAVAGSNPALAPQALVLVAEALTLGGQPQKALETLEAALPLTPPDSPFRPEIQRRINSFKKN